MAAVKGLSKSDMAEVKGVLKEKGKEEAIKVALGKKV